MAFTQELHEARAVPAALWQVVPSHEGTAAMNSLLPCPFCGSTPHFERLGTPRQSCIVECGNCGCRLESSDEGERNGTQWNDQQDAADAPRYRWLCQHRLGWFSRRAPVPWGKQSMKDALDTAIDAVRPTS